MKYIIKRDCIFDTELGMSIPLDERNRFYQEYLIWCETNTPDEEDPAPHTNEEILAQLREIDLKSIRALRSSDTEFLASLEQEAVALRAQLI